MLRETRKKTVKEQIIRTAIELFKQKGYDSVTVEEIAAHCGIAKGTFFNYFAKKEHVLLHLAESHMQLMDHIVQNRREGALKERLLHIMQDVAAIYLQHADLLRLTLIETLKAAVEARSETTNISLFREALRAMIADAKRVGTLRSRWDADASAAVLAGLFFNTLITCPANLSDISASLQRQLDIVWGGIAADE